LERPQALRLRDLHPPKLSTPPIQRLFRNSVLAAYVTDVPQHLRIVQNPNDLLFRKSFTFQYASCRYVINLTHRLDAL
jgi:hypothetical protein